MDNNLSNMDNDPTHLKLDSLKRSPLANLSLNKGSESPINQELLHIPHKHMLHILRKLRREKTVRNSLLKPVM